MHVTLLAQLILLDPIICKVQTDISHCAVSFTHEFRLGAVNVTITFTASCFIPSYTSNEKAVLLGYTVHQQYQTLYYPINALNYMNCRLLKTH